MRYSIPEHISCVMALIKDHGFSPYLVGGCVRDHIMCKKPNDYDITVDALPQEIMEIFEKNGYKTELKGGRFGTVTVYTSEGETEITPHRTEGSYSDSRHPDSVCFVKDLRLDLIRRDFTVNAMAMDNECNIIDEFGGLDDIRNGIIRCVGDPDIRFGEDALRILRAMRFAARFGFEIEQNTRRAMSEKRSGINSISGERIKTELFGILNAPHAYTLLCECHDVISYVINGFKADDFLLKDEGDTVIRLFSCIHNNSFEDICSICDKLKLCNTESEKIRMMHILYNDILTRDVRKVIFDDATKKALCEYKPDHVKAVFMFSGSCDSTFEDYLQNGIYESSRLSVTGGDIASSGLFPRNETARILKLVLSEVACGKLENTKEAVMTFLNDKRNNISE